MHIRWPIECSEGTRSTSGTRAPHNFKYQRSLHDQYRPYVVESAGKDLRCPNENQFGKRDLAGPERSHHGVGLKHILDESNQGGRATLLQIKTDQLAMRSHANSQKPRIVGVITPVE